MRLFAVALTYYQGTGPRPWERVVAHLELADEFPNECVGLVNRDPAQASEKLYKAAEETVKALAAALRLNETRTALEQDMWTAALLFNAVDSISNKLSNEDVRLWWRAAWFLHVEGFRETRLNAEQVRRDLKYVEALMKLAREHVQVI